MFVLALAVAGAEAPSDRVGNWDGVIPEATLAGPYEDPFQKEVPFGFFSYALVPWRAYMDTWPASRLLELPGFNSNLQPEEVEATFRVLAEAGFLSGRIEVNWGGFMSFDSEGPRPKAAERLAATLEAMKKYGIRPLILLNANSGDPVPGRNVKTELLESAETGQRWVRLAHTDQIRTHRTGFIGQTLPGTRIYPPRGFPLITRIGAEGWVELSAPLVKPVPAGPLILATLKYPPLGGRRFEDGTENPDALETREGWMAFVRGVATLAKETLGTGGSADAGFDLEVWNELSFGSHFLQEKFYYQPPRIFADRMPRDALGRTQHAFEELLPMVVDFVNDPGNALPGVRVISGFASQRPWESGTTLTPGQAGFSRHYYVTLERPDDALALEGKWNKPEIGVIDARGQLAGERDPSSGGKVLPGTVYTPWHRVGCPEFWTFAYKTEFLTRDLQPFPGPWRGHGRYTHPGDGRQAEVWMTEFNVDRNRFSRWLSEETGRDHKTDPEMQVLLQHIGAKNLLRSIVFLAHKGVQTINFFSLKSSLASLGLLPEAYFAALKASGGELTQEVRDTAGLQVEAVGRLTKLFREGEALAEARPLGVEKVVEHKPRLVFAGNGTPGAPDRFHRDDLAILPYQLTASRFAIGCYVVTRNVTHVWDPARGPLDPARYDMPPQDFDVTFSNVRGDGAEVSLYDPLTNREEPARILSASPTTLTVRMALTDSPRILLLQEAKPGPLIRNPLFSPGPDNSADLRFALDRPLAVKVSHGSLPDRNSGGEKLLAASTDFSVKMDGITQQTGVRVEVEEDGLKAWWPRWGWDVAGVRWAGTPQNRATPQEAIAVDRIITLPDHGAPSGFTPQSLPWRETNRGFECEWESPAGAVLAGLVLDPGSPAEVQKRVADLSELDLVSARRTEWAGRPAVLVDVQLDPAAHPGEKCRFHRYWLTPLRKGTLVFSVRADRRDALEDRQIRVLREGVTFQD